MNNKIRNRKGFTLAELLIVVAIIAVLTAIAVPLFVGALSNAKQSVKDANVRAVRSAAVSTILLNETKDATDATKYDYTKVDGTGTADATNWKVVAYVDAKGGIHDMTIQALGGTAPAETSSCTELTANESGGKGLKGEYKVEMTITSLKVTGTKAAGG